MQFLNISTQNVYKNINIKYVSRFAKIKQWKRINPGQYVINKGRLPIHIKLKLKQSANYSLIFNDKEILSNNWSMIINIGGLWKNKTNESHLTIFHPKDLNNAYNFELPLFLNKVINPSIIYNSNNEILYAMNGKTIYSLDFNASISNKKWKWNVLYNNLKCMRFDTSLCLINNNLFIIGGSSLYSYSLNYVELFAINSMRSIWCKNMNKSRINAGCVYHDKFHQIIVCSDDNLEYYDINKDEWIMIESKTNYIYCDKPNIWISHYNPNILFISARVNTENHRIGIVTEMIDLRKTNSKCKILSLYDIDYNLNYDTDYGSVTRFLL